MSANLTPHAVVSPTPPLPSVPPERSFIATWMFSWLLGFLGVDRFYLGKIGTGIAKLLTIGGLGVWWLIDLILTLAGVQRDKEGRLLPDFEEHKMMAWIITASVFGLSLLTSALAQIFVYIPARFGPMMPWWVGQ
ncbi:TM2 domain-containing protein [Microbacterium insulae]|uniref:TM2 domain-containing protein n=1 Tax=Microbacterium insulae TaxID=483014 RepID=A0ABW3ALY7_9MICO